MESEIRMSGSRNQLIEVYRGRISESIDSDTLYIGSDKYHLNYCGREDCLPGHTYGPNKRSSYLIHLIKKGQGIYTTKSRTYQIRENQSPDPPGPRGEAHLGAPGLRRASPGP